MAPAWAVAFAEVRIRLAAVGINDLHALMRALGTGSCAMASLANPRLNKILAAVKSIFPPSSRRRPSAATIC
jgi:hypothetical protein